MKEAYRIAAAGILLVALVQSSSAFWREKDSASEQADRHAKQNVADAGDTARSDLLAEIERLQNAFSFFRQERDILKEDIEELRTDKKRLEDQVRRLESELEKSDERIEKLKKKGGSGNEAQVERLEAQLKEERKLRTTYELRADQMGREIKALQAMVAERDKALARQDRSATAAQQPEPQEVAMTEPAMMEQVIEEIDIPQEPEPEEEWFPAEPAELITRANESLADGDVEEAKQYFREALSGDPASVEALIGLAACSYTEGELIQAKTLVTRALASDPENAEALGLHGIIMWREGDTEQAVAAIERAIGIDGNDAQLHNYMGIVRHDEGDLGAAAKEFGRAVDMDPEHVEARFNLSVVLATSEQPRLDEAREHYEKALRLGSERNEALEDILYP